VSACDNIDNVTDGDICHSSSDDWCCSLVVCNLYPFSQTVSAGDVTIDGAVEQIDIGNCVNMFCMELL